MKRDSPLVFRIYARSANILYYDSVTEKTCFYRNPPFPENYDKNQGTMNRIKNRTERSSAIKMLIIFAGFIGLAGLIIGRLANYQIEMYDYYQTKVLNQLTIQTDVTPERGTITDRNGNILATNKTVYNVLLSPQDILNRVEADKKSVKAREEFLLSKEFRELDAKKQKEAAKGAMMEAFARLLGMVGERMVLASICARTCMR